MTSSPALWALLTDVLWCTGLGLLLGFGRDAVGLAFGNGRLRCFFWDLLAFLLAAVALCGFAAGVSASGISRWYMAAALAAGAAGWHWGLSAWLHTQLRRGLRLLAWPLRTADRLVALPAKQAAKSAVLRRKNRRAAANRERKKEKTEKKSKKGKKVLQKGRRILYN